MSGMGVTRLDRRGKAVGRRADGELEHRTGEVRKRPGGMLVRRRRSPPGRVAALPAGLSKKRREALAVSNRPIV